MGYENTFGSVDNREKITTKLINQANTMLLYPLQEAIDLLETKLSGAEKSLEETIEDLEWLREQVTVMEVNFARVHNVSRAFFSRTVESLPPSRDELR